MKRIWNRFFALLLAVVMTLSLLPAAALAAPRRSGRAGGEVIDVTDYGADPTGVEESSTAVIKALAAAAELPEGTQKTIYFPKGEYHFYDEYSESRLLYVTNTLKQSEPEKYRTKYIGILVEGMQNVTIDGGGSQFIFHGNICTLGAIDSQNVTFQNFDMDHASPTVVDVTVEAYEGETAAILYVPACYTYRIVNGNSISWEGERGPISGTPYWTGSGNLGYRQGFNTITGQTTRSPGNLPFSNVSSIEEMGDGRLKVTYSSAANRPTLGMCFQMRNPNPRMTPGTFFWQSDGVTLNNIDVQYLHGFGMVGQLSKNITLDTVKFEARPGTGRTTAGFADFVQMSSVGGTVTLRNCEFSNPHDDPINIHGTFLKVTAISDDRRTVTVKYQHNETWGFPQYYVGDTVDFSTQGSMAPVADSARTVVAVVNPGEGGNDLTTIRVTLDEAIPSSITANSYVMENVTYTPDVLIENCRFVETPTRGILVTTRGEVVIQNNYFDRMGMAAIYISCDAAGWWESGRTENVTIRNNTFVVNPHTSNQAAIFVDPTGLGAAGNRVHKNMVIENNVFNMDNVSHNINVNAVNARGVDGLTIRGNIIQRYQPNVTLSFGASSTELEVGGVQSTTIASDGATTYTAQVFRLEQCENVTISDNHYDDGLNLGVGLSGTAASQVTVVGDDLTVGGSNQRPAVGAVSYFSSDPAVATVDANGMVTGVSAGTAEIYAFRTAGARTFESNHLTFTVTPSAAVTVNSISVSGNDTVDVGGTLNLTAATDPVDAGTVTWVVKPLTDGAAAAIDQNGVLSATAPGVVEVTASLGGVSASKLVTVNKPNFDYLSDLDWTSATTGDGSWNNGTPAKDGAWEGKNMSLRGEDGSEVRFEKGVGTHANSTIVYDIAGKGYTTFSSNFGISYYKSSHSDAPNLKFKVLNGNSELFAGDATVNEAYKETGNVDISGVESLTLTVTTNKGNTYSAHGNWADAKLYSDNAAPTADNVKVDIRGGVVTLTYDYNDTDGDAETDSLIVWYVSDTRKGQFVPVAGANTTTLPVTAATGEKWAKAVVVPRDATGRYGAPVTAPNAAPVPEVSVVDDDATLSALSVSGLTLTPAFDPAVTAYTLDVPASAQTLNVTATPAQKSAQVSGAGNVTLTGASSDIAILVTAPDGSTTETYTVTVRRAQSSDATLSALTATAGSKSISFDPDTRFYELVAEQGTQNMVFSVTPADNATVQVRYNAEEKGEYEGQMSLPLNPGINNLELRVTAEDGVSTALYRVRVMKPASTEAELTALTINGSEVTLPDDESTDLGLFATAADGSAGLTYTVSEGAGVRINVDGKSVEGGETFTVTGISQVKLRVVAEDGVTEKVYTLLLSKPDPANADLYSLDIAKLALSPAFDADTLSYTASSEVGQTTLAAMAAQPDASITYETVSIYKTVTGRLSDDCTFFRDVENNFIKITVTSPNGKVTKTYTVDVTYTPTMYLSDMQWTSHTSGWAGGWPNPGVDVAVENKVLTLRGENGTETFEKGLGTHANSTTVFDLSALGATRFTAKVGPNQLSGGSPHIAFTVQGDGEQLWTSGGELTHADVYKTIDIDITGVNELKLLDTQSGANSNAHATWADAKLQGGNLGPALANNSIPISYVAFDRDELTLYTNQSDPAHTATLSATVKPAGAVLGAEERVLSWSSDDPSVATVNDGEIVAVGVGETTITATAPSGVSASVVVITKQKIVGEVSIDGKEEYNSTLTAVLNTFDQVAKENLDIQWYRDNTALSGETAQTYTVAEGDIGHTITVKVTARDPYEGESSATTGVIDKAAGPAMQATPTHRNVSAEGTADGAITGLFKGRKYQYLEWDFADGQPGEDAAWIDFCDDSAVETPSEGQVHGTAEITGLGVGKYVVRRAADGPYKAGPISNTVHIVVRTADMYDLTNPHDFEGGVVQARRIQIPEGDTVTLVVTPNEGYQLVENSLKAVTADGTEYIAVESAAKGAYTFTMPAADVTIAAEFEKKTYTITHGVEHITCDMEEHDHTVSHGEAFTITLTPEEGYDMPTRLTVTPSDVYFTYKTSETDPSKRVVTFEHGVTSNIAITGAAVLKSYTVVYDLQNGLTASGAAQTVQHGKDLAVTLTAARGYALPDEVAVTVKGEELTAEDFTYDGETGKIVLSGVTGNVTISAQGVAQGVALQSVTLVGPARVDRTLTVNTVPVLATVEYQWIMVDEDGTEIPIEGATGQTYVIPDDAEGKTIQVKVTGTGSYNGELTSQPTKTILSAAEPFVFVSAITLDPAETSVKVGKSVTIAATVTPDNATAPTLFWTSDNEAIAKVDQNGKVTGVAEGVVTITATSTDTALDSRVYAYCTVTVTKAEISSRPSGGSSTSSTSTTVVTGEDGSKVTTVTTKDGDKTITVTDPEGEEIIKVEIPAVIPEAEEKFEDLDSVPWAQEAVNNVAALELVKGTGGNKYDPIAPMTRGSLATVLHRLSQGKTDYEVTFKDVAAGRYYTEGVAWAAKVNVVTGYTAEIFAPDDIITREQLAVMLARYAKLIGMDTKADTNALDQFVDADATGDWAVDGVAWCVEKGLLKGKGMNNLDPTAEISRAEVAVLLDRFIQLIR